jgi:hypothetical protein
MIQHVIRIENVWLRVLLVTLLFPLYHIHSILTAWLPVRLGGHPSKRRLLELDYYLFPVGVYLAALLGEFVP